MSKLNRFKSSFVTLTGIMCVAVGYELKNLLRNQEFYYSLAIIILSLIISKFASSFISNVLFKIRWLRSVVLGNSSIEGYWFVYPNVPNPRNILNSDSLSEISYNHDAQSLQTITYRTDDKGNEIFSYSDFVMFDEVTGGYINRFTFLEDNQRKDGIAFGNFLGIPNKGRLNKWQGICMNIHDNIIYGQQGTRISEKEVEEYEEQYPSNWHIKMLNSLKTAKQNQSRKSILQTDPEK